MTREEVLERTLKAIVNWDIPKVEARDGTIVSYGTEYGSNGEKDYIRKLADNALKFKESTHVVLEP